MNELPKIVLSLSLSGTLFFLILLFCKPVIKNKLSKKWQYYIWLLVIARMLLPIAPKINLMGMVFVHFDHTIMQAEGPVLQDTDILMPEESQSEEENSNLLETQKSEGENLFGLTVENGSTLCLFLWLIVAVGMLIRKITIYQSFAMYTKAGCTEVSDIGLWEQAGKIIEQTGVKKPVGLYKNSLISSPFLMGFFHPCIMLPTKELSDTEFQFTILHELIHYYYGIPHNYAWQPEINKNKASIKITDMGKSTENYVLLAIPKNLKLTIYYNSKQVSYKVAPISKS